MKRPVKYKGNGNILVVDGIDYVIPNHVLVWLPEPREPIWIIDSLTEISSGNCTGCYIRFHKKTLWMQWFKNSALHRENNKPSLISFDKDDPIYWHYERIYHRINGPAVY